MDTDMNTSLERKYAWNGAEDRTNALPNYNVSKQKVSMFISLLKFIQDENGDYELSPQRLEDIS